MTERELLLVKARHTETMNCIWDLLEKHGHNIPMMLVRDMGDLNRKILNEIDLEILKLNIKFKQ